MRTSNQNGLRELLEAELFPRVKESHRARLPQALDRLEQLASKHTQAVEYYRAQARHDERFREWMTALRKGYRVLTELAAAAPPDERWPSRLEQIQRIRQAIIAFAEAIERENAEPSFARTRQVQRSHGHFITVPIECRGRRSDVASEILRRGVSAVLHDLGLPTTDRSTGVKLEILRILRMAEPSGELPRKRPN